MGIHVYHYVRVILQKIQYASLDLLHVHVESTAILFLLF